MNESEQKNKTEDIENIQKIQNWYVVWLGNAGKKYTTTRHNAAWLIAHTHILKNHWKEHGYSPALVYNDVIAQSEVFHLCPITLMNRSGRALGWFIQKKGLTHKNLIVIHDDYHLPLGSVKVSHNRGDAGHNGVASINTHIKTKNYTRIRIGIGECPAHIPLEKYVLMPFYEQEKTIIQNKASGVFEIIESVIMQGVEKTMNTWNGK